MPINPKLKIIKNIHNLKSLEQKSTCGGFGTVGIITVAAILVVLIGVGWYVEQLTGQWLISRPLPDEPITVIGKVVEIDAEPLARDGDGVLRLWGENGERITVFIPARETLCEAKGELDVFHQVRLDDTVEAFGLGNKNVVRVCNSPDHYLKIINKDITSASVPSGVEDWKTYRNEQYGFEVRYPPDWKLTEVIEPVDATFISIGENRFGILPLGEFDFGPPWEEPIVSDLQVGGRWASVTRWYGWNSELPSAELRFVKFKDPPASWGKHHRLDIYTDSIKNKVIADQILFTFKFIE